MIEIVSPHLSTLYQDLVDAHLGRTPSDRPGGAPFRRIVRGKPYWYASERSGARIVQRYLGPDNEAVRARIDALAAARDEGRTFETRAAEMVAQLRAARLPTLDPASGRILAALSRAGAFDVGATLVGTAAFRLYDLELGRRVSRAAPAQTQDIDIASFQALSVALAGDPQTPTSCNLVQALASLSLSPAASLDPQGRSSRWRSGGLPALDILAPSFDVDQGLVWLEALGVWAQGLHFLGFLLADPIPAVGLYRHGVLVRIPKPERFAIHKLILAQLRAGPGIAKRPKDLAQARALALALAEDRSAELRAAHEEALARGPRWREAIAASLAMLPEVARVL